MLGVWNTARANKENILYAIVTIVLLERVRTGWNRLETEGRRRGLIASDIERRQSRFLVKAAVLYGLLLVLPVVKYIFRSIEELSWTVEGLAVLKSIWAFLAVVVFTETFLSVVIYNLLRVYIDRMNAAIGFFAAIGRNIWDGSKAAVQVGTNATTRVVGGVKSTAGRAKTGIRRVGALTRRLPTAAAALTSRMTRFRPAKEVRGVWHSEYGRQTGQ